MAPGARFFCGSLVLCKPCARPAFVQGQKCGACRRNLSNHRQKQAARRGILLARREKYAAVRQIFPARQYAGHIVLQILGNVRVLLANAPGDFVNGRKNLLSRGEDFAVVRQIFPNARVLSAMRRQILPAILRLLATVARILSSVLSRDDNARQILAAVHQFFSIDPIPNSIDLAKNFSGRFPKYSRRVPSFIVFRWARAAVRCADAT